MPNKANARKALRQSKKNAVANLLRRDTYKAAIKKVVKAPSKDEALKLVSNAQQALDKAAQRGALKKNAASRKLSRLMRKVSSQSAK